MTIHMVKLCVGAETIDDLRAWQDRQTRDRRARDLPPRPACQTRMTPKRDADLLDGGSIYWVIKGAILVRQEIRDLIELFDTGGRKYCELDLDPKLVLTEPTPKKPFQGWRYLKPDEAPSDLMRGSGAAKLPPSLARDLREAGVW